ncbi:hypothetical protein B0H16DRAFT_1339053, partial [Mycena metata]
CTKCFPAVSISTKNYQRILEHNACHILFDKSFLPSDQPCGLCLRPFPMCKLTFLKSSGTAAARQIDWDNSSCLNPVKFQMAAAMKSSEKSPCTNYAFLCPLQCGLLVWTYTLEAHFRSSTHGLKSLANLPVYYKMAEMEFERMQVIWNNRHNQPVPRTMKNLKGKVARALAISDAHRSIMALR